MWGNFVLNWTMAVYIGFIASVLIAVAFALSLEIYIREKSRYSLNMAISRFFVFLWSFLQSLSILFLWEELYILSLYSVGPIGVFLLITLDYMSRDNVNPIKMSIFCIGMTAMLFTSLEPGSVTSIVYLSGEQGLTWHGSFALTVAGLLVCIGVLVVHIAIKIYRNAPTYLKRPARLFLLGGIIAGPLAILLDMFFDASTRIPGFDLLVIGVGALISAAVLKRDPKLAYVLPFKALRLAVIDVNGGLPLFTHTWHSGRNLIEEGLFSGMLQSVTIIIRESVQRGQIREIVMDNGVMLIQRSDTHPIACVLVTTKASRVLRQALAQFVSRFCEEFSSEFKDINYIAKFNGAAHIIDECFPFIP